MSSDPAPRRSREARRRAPHPTGARVPVALAVTLLALCWILGNPRSSGPDESSHMVTAAGVVRFEFDGTVDPANPAVEIFTLPEMVGSPDPGCWAQQPDVSVACASAISFGTGDSLRSTTSSNYAPWALVLPGLASFVPDAGAYAYLARALDALIPVLLMASSLVLWLRRRPIVAAALLAGTTPIVWFTFGVVNPSAIAIAGGLALWTGLLVDADQFDAGQFDAGQVDAGQVDAGADPDRESVHDRGVDRDDVRVRPHDRTADIVALAGWAALLLARRDGPLWATAIVVACCALVPCRPVDWWLRLGRLRWIAVAIVPVTLVPSLQLGDLGFNLLLALTPLLLPAVDRVVVWWRSHPERAARQAFVGMSVLGVVLVVGALLTLRPSGFRAETIRLVMSNTGNHLQQLVGVLGWLDAPVPTSAVFLYWATLGGLATVALLERQRSAVVLALALAATVGTAWLLELGQGADYGQYWQGRYSMPFAVGLPVVAAWRSGGAGLIDRLTVPLAVSAWIVLNAGYFAAQRRWAVGIDGTFSPWHWDSWGAPLPPIVLLAAHLVVSAWLVAIIVSHAPRPDVTT